MSELGARLRTARETKGLSLEELQEITKIQKRYLSAIEEGNYEVMPGKFYARAFIKQYAEAVDLDSDQIFEEYKSDIPPADSNEISSQLSRVKTSRKAAAAKDSKILTVLPKVVTVLLVIAVIAVIWIWMQNLISEDPKPDNSASVPPAEKEIGDIPEDPEPPADGEPKENGNGDNDETPAEDPPKPTQQLVEVEKSKRSSVFDLKNADQFILSFTSPGKSYLNVKNGSNETLFDGMVTSEKPLELDVSSEKQVTLNIGRAFELSFEVNGEAFEYPFEPTETIHQYVTINVVKETHQ